MQNPYCLGVDVWEGQLEIDESLLKANNIKFLFIRLNDINGGHHKDENFDKQWSEAAGFYRAPYFVFNPWISGQKNYDWLLANMPADAKLVALDIEVVYSGISAAAYAAEVANFRSLVAKKWKSVVYTGEWFLKYLTSWGAGDYWWAQYPLLLYPSSTQTITWDQFRAKLDTLTRPMNESRCPGNVVLWQCSADRFILPGSTRPIDVNVFFGDETKLAELFGGIVETPPPPTGDDGMNDTQFNQLIAALGKIEAAIKGISLPSTPTDPGTPDPDPVENDGYTGKYLGLYRVKEDPTAGVKFLNLQDSYGSDETVLMDRMYDWLSVNCPDFDEFVNPSNHTPPTVWKVGDLWHIKLRVYRGQVIKVAEIASGRARVIGFDSEGSSISGAKNLAAISTTKTPWFFHKVPGFPRWWPIVQPRQNKPVLQAAWIDAALIEKAI